MIRKDLAKTFFDDFSFKVEERGIELRAGSHPTRPVGKPRVVSVRKEWIRDTMYQSFGVTVLQKGFSPLLESWVKISIRCGFLDRHYGHQGDYNRAQIAVANAFYGDSDLIRHTMYSFIEWRANGSSSNSSQYPVRSVDVTFSLGRHDLTKVRVYAQLKVDNTSVFEVATDPVGLEDSREEFILLLNQMVPAMRKYAYSSEPETAK